MVGKRCCRGRMRDALKGVTLLELLVVIGLCGTMALLLVPMVLRARSNSRTVVCANNLKGLGQAYVVCLNNSGNYFPDAYYTYEGADGEYMVSMRSPDGDSPDTLLREGTSSILSCPSDDSPVDVIASTPAGTVMPVASSYGYNVSLPTMYRNAARVNDPANTVTFYDGDASAVVGEWQHTMGWAADSVRPRHRNGTNYLFLDGHVECSPSFPDLSFEGGSRWVASALDTTATGNNGNWAWGWSDEPDDGDDGDGKDDDDDDDDGDDGDDEEEVIDFTIIDGAVIPNETCDVTILCLGTAFQNGAGGSKIPVTASYEIDNDGWEEITDEVCGGEKVVVHDVEPSMPIATRGEWSLSWGNNGDYESNDGSGHTWVLRDGDVVPSISGYAGQAPIEGFLSPYMTADGTLTLGPNDAIFLFELSSQINYQKYSWADFQDLVILVTFSEASGNAGGSDGSEEDEDDGTGVSGAININPSNNTKFEFTMMLPDGTVVTRDDLFSYNPTHHEGEGFHPDYLQYTGPAVSVVVKPKGNGNQNGLTVDGEPYPLQNKSRYTITSDDMQVFLRNTKYNKTGKAMGKWWIDIDAKDATIETN